MAILTATEVTLYSNISASAATISASGLIPIVQERITMITNNYFDTDLDLTSTMTFNTTARTILAESSFEEKNFMAGDDILIYNSYRNDGYYTIESVSGSTLTLVSGSTVIDELSGRTIMASVVKWPLPIKQIAAQMIAYDYDVRPNQMEGIKSRSLGPWSESYGEDKGGYPDWITHRLIPYRKARLM